MSVTPSLPQKGLPFAIIKNIYKLMKKDFSKNRKKGASEGKGLSEISNLLFSAARIPHIIPKLAFDQFIPGEDRAIPAYPESRGIYTA
jgi:hypothetical protein